MQNAHQVVQRAQPLPRRRRRRPSSGCRGACGRRGRCARARAASAASPARATNSRMVPRCTVTSRDRISSSTGSMAGAAGQGRRQQGGIVRSQGGIARCGRRATIVASFGPSTAVVGSARRQLRDQRLVAPASGRSVPSGIPAPLPGVPAMAPASRPVPGMGSTSVASALSVGLNRRDRPAQRVGLRHQRANIAGRVPRQPPAVRAVRATAGMARRR